MKLGTSVLLAVSLQVQAQYFDDSTGDVFDVQPNLNTAPGEIITDDRGNRWLYQPNLNTAPGGTIIRERSSRSRERWEDYDPAMGNTYRR